MGSSTVIKKQSRLQADGRRNGTVFAKANQTAGAVADHLTAPHNKDTPVVKGEIERI